MLPENLSPEGRAALVKDLDANKDGTLQVTETAVYAGTVVDVVRVQSELTPESGAGAAKRDEIAEGLRTAATPENITAMHNDLGAMFTQGAEPIAPAEAQALSVVAMEYAEQIATVEHTLAGDEERRLSARQAYAERSLGDLADRNNDGRVGLGERLLFEGRVGLGSLLSREGRDVREAARDADVSAGADRAQRYSKDVDPALQWEERSSFGGRSAVGDMEAALREARAAGVEGDYRPEPTDRSAPKSPNQAIIDEAVAKESSLRGK